jgi:hypothetical protein
MRPRHGSTKCYGNGIWFNCRTMRNPLRRSPNHFMLCVRMISHHRRGDTRSRTRIGKSKDVGRMYDRSDAGRPIAEFVYVAGYAPNGKYYTGLTDQREPVEQRSTSSRPSATALRTSLPPATLGTYVETIRSMPTPYGLVSASQNLVEH